MKRCSGVLRALSSSVSLSLELTGRRLVRSTRGRGSALLAGAIMFAPQGLAAAEYEFSYGPSGVNLEGNGWPGRHSFLDVYCVDFPDPGSVTRLDEGLLNGNAISYFRATYKGPILAFIVTSTVPKGRSEAQDFTALLDNEYRAARTVNADPPGNRYRMETGKSAWGPVIRLQLTDIAENTPAGPFPLSRAFYSGEGEGQRLHSVHRIFVKGSNRFEIAVIGALEASDTTEAKIALEGRLGKLADKLVASLQRCKADNSAASQ
ncbi:hypothetical protein SAMN05216569_2362 [Pseudoxanthomonas sp. CF125]|nr:hypothetical protein SAMN05216569_2362 [Pseudoxanthomonas sp. CF125]